jgi:hypothetical protein
MKMDELQHPEFEAEQPNAFAALRDEIEHGPLDEIEHGPPDKERRIRELDQILGARCHPDDYDDSRFHDTWDEVEAHASLASADPARQRAAAVVEELLDSSELRQALLPILFAEGPNVLRDWVYIWRYLEEERQTLLFAVRQESSARDDDRLRARHQSESTKPTTEG